MKGGLILTSRGRGSTILHNPSILVPRSIGALVYTRLIEIFSQRPNGSTSSRSYTSTISRIQQSRPLVCFRGSGTRARTKSSEVPQ